MAVLKIMLYVDRKSAVDGAGVDIGIGEDDIFRRSQASN